MKSASTPMSINAKQPRIPLFFVIGVGLSLLMASLKAVVSGLAETYLYSVPWMGGFLRSIELSEISNLVVFAILGAGIGGATFLLPRRWNHQAKMALLVVASPFVFSASYMVQQHMWIQRVAERAEISYRDARQITDAFLKRESGSAGFFGFYPFSTRLADLPTRRQDLEAAHSTNVNEMLAQELTSYNDPRADVVAFMFKRVGWAVRLMYMIVAALTGLIYYFKGHDWAESQRQAGGSNPHSRQSRVKPKAP